jgi:hypothetical protein
MSSDEDYVIRLCDEILGSKAIRQHTFSFLTGDSGRRLPVDAFYKPHNLVVEYRERQHSETGSFFDRKQTVSGCNRGEQRRQYDQRRRDVMPQHGLWLVEIDFSELAHNGSKRLLRAQAHDKLIIARKLGQLNAQALRRRRQSS